MSILLIIYLVGFIIVGLVAARHFWQHGGTDFGRPHNPILTFVSFFSYGASWPVLAALIICVEVYCWGDEYGKKHS